MDRYEYKVQYRTSSGVWRGIRTFTDVINARVFKRLIEALHRTTEFRMVRNPAKWEVCQ